MIGVNEYWGWYDRISIDGTGEDRAPLPIELPELERCLAERSALGVPILLTEFGADAEPGFVNDACPPWSENYQAELIRRTLEIAAKYPAVRGTFPFLYNDYRDPSKPVNEHWHGVNLKGIVSYDRRRKLAWRTVKDSYAGSEAAHDR